MSQPVSLKDAERRVFRAAYNDGLWDILLACFILMFAVAPLLSASLGDFWSSAVFLPFWGLAALVIWLVRRYVLRPRVGVVKFGPARKARLLRFNILMLLVNSIALVLGIVAALYFNHAPRLSFPILIGAIFLFFCSLVAHFLEFTRLYLYGLLLGISPLVGEWLYTRWQVPHHGYPVAFGVTAAAIFLSGMVIFIRVLRYNPRLDEAALAGEA